MGSLYLIGDKEEIDRRRKLVDPSRLVEVWQDLFTPGIAWIGEASKRALDSVGQELAWLVAVDETVVPVYYGPRLRDVESLPLEESLRARVLSAHGIAVAWATYDESGARTGYQPKAPTDEMFFLRRPRGRAAHLWRLFRTKPEAVASMAEHVGTDPEAAAWAERLASEDFSGMLERFGQKG